MLTKEGEFYSLVGLNVTSIYFQTSVKIYDDFGLLV